MDQQNSSNENTGQAAPAAPAAPVSTGKKKLIIGVVVVLALLLVAQWYLSPERIAERVLERSTGGAVDVDLTRGTVKVNSDEGNVNIDTSRGTVSMTNENGEKYVATSGENVKLPENWPDTIPIESDARLSHAGAVTGADGKTALTVAYETAKSASEVSEYYASHLGSNGWKIVANLAYGDGSMISATRNEEESAVVYVSAVDGKTTVSLTVQAE